LGDELAQVLPHQNIQLLSGNASRTTSLIMLRVDRLGLTATDVIPESSVGSSGNAGGLTRSATDQRPQKVAVALVVACRLLLVQSQFHLHSVEILLVDQGRHRSDQGPRLCRRRILPVCRVAQGMGGRPSDAGRPGSTSTNIQLARVNRIDEQAANRSRTPTLISTRGWKTELQQMLCQAQQSAFVLQISCEQLPHDGAFCWFNLHTSRISGAIRG
jgi:hypothetical protein